MFSLFKRDSITLRIDASIVSRSNAIDQCLVAEGEIKIDMKALDEFKPISPFTCLKNIYNLDKLNYAEYVGYIKIISITEDGFTIYDGQRESFYPYNQKYITAINYDGNMLITYNIYKK